MTAVATVRNQPIVTTPAPAPTREQRLLATREVAAIATEQARALIEPLLAKSGSSFEQVLTETYLAVQKNADLLKCAPESLLSAVARSVSWGLRIGETVHLVPFGPRCEAVRDYKGDIELVIWSGAARSIDAQCVYMNEMDATPPRFKLVQGSRPDVMHEPILMPSMRGKLAGAYAVARISQTEQRVVFMSTEEIDAIRLSKSKSWKSGPLDAIPWYARKTVVHQVCKMLPKTRRFVQVEAAFDEERMRLIDDAEPRAIAAEGVERPGLDPANEVRPASSTTASSTADVVAAADPGFVAGSFFVAPEDPAPAAEDDGVMTFEKALHVLVPGGKKAFDGQGGKPLGDLNIAQLKALGTYFETRITDAEKAGGQSPSMFVEVRDACKLIVDDHARKSATSEKVDTKLAPGNLEDAYDKKPLERPAPTLDGVRAQVLALIKDPKLDDLERDLVKSRLAKVDSVDAALLILQDLETTLSLPF